MPSCTHLPRRPVCHRCQRPAAACICAAVRPVAHQVQVLILMHPLEQHQAKGTARLLHLCLPGSRIVVGETFDHAALVQEINAPWVDGDRQAPRRAVLLYPPTPPNPQHPMLPAPPLSTDWLAVPERLRLVVLDGTWRKSRRMLWANPALQALPRLALQQVPPTRYAVRKAHAPHQLSTLEAAQCALQQLEPANPHIAALGQAMDALMALLCSREGAARSAMLGPDLS
ncbi:tRNA-uridine aminocarboxypropyltransferase [Diaphorobacter nitroreducens]|uniref:tRNA-uridine aminocarboxypropyltransferase n=1 Tax=Diaphorobacter nitroreducens TaxID=164759 RepID=UPI00289800DC|nr:tRNA-uridine aminocarboxypropyltransferase [Diaphorobacter nitroreducens]